MDKPGHILIIRLSSVGDVVLATPVAAVLRMLYPEACITWLADVDYLDLVKANPNIDRAVGFDYTGKHRGSTGIRRLAAEIKPVDLLVDLQHKVRSVLLSAHIRAAQRKVWIKRCSLNSLKVLVGRRVILRGPHQVERYLLVLGADIGDMEIPLPLLRVQDRHQQEAIRLFRGISSSDTVVGLFPGSRHDTKRWPVMHMIRLADRIRSQGLSVAVLGGGGEAGLVRAVASGMRDPTRLVHAGGSLGLLTGLISMCRVVVSPDSGPAHMAAALGVPVVALFGPTSPERWAPAGPKSRVLQVNISCSPCSNYGGATCPVDTLECMHALEPDRVWQAVMQAISDS